jgi:PAS domain S-box-containing protein
MPLLSSTDAYRALESNEFFPVFQPLVELRTGHLEGFEVLARWSHPSRGIISPAEFIPLAEKDGWIADLTRSMLRKAFAAIADLPVHLKLAINVSPVQLHDLTLPKQILFAAETAGIAMDRITVEITESALAEYPEQARAIVRELKAMGCSLALDDFGTGYSSLLTLQSLPFDQLKVDRSFVSSMAERRESRKIVAAVVSLGQSLGLVTIAEGVETQEQAEMLLWLECNLAQGWFYGKPVSAEDLPAVTVAPPKFLNPTANVAGQARRLSLSNFNIMPERRLAQLHALYDGAPVGLAFLDGNLRYVMLNQRLADINGVPMHDHLGKTGAEIIPQLYPKLEPYLLRALSGHPVSDLLIRNNTSVSGEIRTTLRSYQPALDEAGEILGVSIAIMDITALEKEREARKQSEETLRYLMDLSPQIPWMLDPSGRAIDVSQRWIEMTGMESGEWRDFGWLEAIHPEDRQPTIEVFREAIASKSQLDLKYRVLDQHSGWRWMHARGAPRLDDEGTVVCWYGALEDIHSEEIRRRNDEHLRLLDSRSQIPWILDSEGKAIDVSQQWLILTGMKQDEWRGDGWLKALHPDDVAKTLEVVRTSVESGTPMDVDYRVFSPGAGFVWMHARGYPRIDANGKILYWYGTVGALQMSNTYRIEAGA